MDQQHKAMLEDQRREMVELYNVSLAAMREHVLKSFLLGRIMVNYMEQMGEVRFKVWLGALCPEIPWSDAQEIMTRCLASPLAERLDKAIEETDAETD